MERLEQFVEYAKLHLISLEQDASKIQHTLDNYVGDYDGDEYLQIESDDAINTGEMHATQHLLSVAQDILSGELAIRMGESNA